MYLMKEIADSTDKVKSACPIRVKNIMYFVSVYNRNIKRWGIIRQHSVMPSENLI